MRRLLLKVGSQVPFCLINSGTGQPKGRVQTGRPAVLFDLDGTLLDSVYQHVLAWQEALEGAGIPLSVWRIHAGSG